MYLLAGLLKPNQVLSGTCALSIPQRKTSKDWTVEEMLEDALEEIKSGNRKANKAMVLFLDDKSGKYNTGFSQSGMSVSQCVALLETAKFDFFKGLKRDGFEF